MAMVNNWKAVFSRVRAALMRRGCTSDDADDLIQEAWLKLACYEMEHPVARPDAFLMRTALNLSIDAYREQRNHGEKVLLDDMTVDELLLAGTAPAAETIVLTRERIARLSASLAGLNATTRGIYLAHRIEGMTYQEIARAHRLSVSSVEKHIARATMVVMRWMEGC